MNMTPREHLEEYKRLKLTALAYELSQATQSEDYSQVVKEYVEKRKLILEAINELTDDNEKLVLMFRYVQGLSWNRTTDAMQEAGAYYCERQIYRIHRRAVKNLTIKEN